MTDDVLLLLALPLVQQFIGADRFLGEAVVLPPADQGGHGGDAGAHDLLHRLALDGQDELAAGPARHHTKP